MDYNLRRTISEAVDFVIREQERELNALYTSDAYILRKKERETLISLSVNLKTTLMDSVVPALEGKVPYVNTLWMASTEELSDVSYVYIVWEQKNGKNDSAESKKNLFKRKTEINLSKIPSLNKKKISKNEELIKLNIDKALRENRSRLIQWCHKVRDNIIENIEKGDSLYE